MSLFETETGSTFCLPRPHRRVLDSSVPSPLGKETSELLPKIRVFSSGLRRMDDGEQALPLVHGHIDELLPLTHSPLETASFQAEFCFQITQMLSV